MKKTILSVFSSLLIILFSGCSSKENKDDKLKVLVTVPPYRYFVEKIAGDFVDVTSLVSEEMNPHLYEPTPKQISDAYQSALWIRTGEAFEQRIAKALLHNNPSLRHIDLSQEYLNLHKENDTHCHSGCHHCTDIDLHFWMSPTIAKEQARAIASALYEVLKDKQDILKENLLSLETELDALHATIASRLKPLAGQSIIVSHPAFGYFCKDFGLVQISIETEGKDPLPRDITKIVEKASHSTARIVLSQIQHSNIGAEAIAKQLELPCASTNPYSSRYEEMLIHLTDLITSKDHE